MRKISDVIIGILLLLLVIYTYRYLFNSFFQQDEWYTLGQSMSKGIFSGLTSYPFYYYLAGYIRYPGTLLNNILHVSFPLNPLPFAILGIVIHWLNSFLVYYLGKHISGNKMYGLLAAIFFSISNVSQQSLSWFASTTTTLPSLFFVLVSVLFMLKSLHSHPRLYIVLSQLSLILSYLFKESSIVLFFFFPLLFICSKKISKTNSIRTIVLFSPSVLYLLFVLFIRLNIFMSPEGKAGVFITSQSNSRMLLIVQLIKYPFIGISQSFIPQQLFVSFIRFTGIHEYQQIIQTMDIYSIVLSLVIILVSIYYFVTYKNKRISVLCAFIFLVANFIPLAVVKRDNTSYFESRYYYLASVGAGLLFSAFLLQIISFLRKKMNTLSLSLLAIVIVFTIGYFYKNISLTRALLLQQNIEGQERKQLLLNIKKMFPNPGHNPVFFVDGDSLGYYGIPGQKLPFQQGIGFTLMVLYYDHGIVPPALLDKPFFWNVNEEGFIKIGDQGFGYVHSKEKLEELLSAEPSLRNNVSSMYWYSSDKKLVKIHETY